MMRQALALLLTVLSAYNADGTCGSGNSCPPNAPCCSKFGYCGSSPNHCAKSKCRANCWPGEDEPKNPWLFRPDGEKRELHREVTMDDSSLTESQIGIYRKKRAFPEEKFGVLVRCADPGVVALTYDDGPSEWTPRLLDTLDREEVKASFLVLARNIDPHFSAAWKRNQATLRDIVKRGHLVGSHSYNHPNFAYVGPWAMEQDMNKANALFKNVLGFCPLLMRPPEGGINAEVASKLHEMGYHIIHWTHDTNDWRRPESAEARAVRYVKSRIPKKGLSKADSVILLQHDTYEGTVNAQRELIKIIKAKGYRFVTLDECIKVSKPYRK